jgi:L-threonylcarbamoyladenylate synthase
MCYEVETRIYRIDASNPEQEIIEIAAKKLQSGGLVAFPTETVYGLGANALSEEAVNRIFSAKGRPASDPVIVHIYALAQLETVVLNTPDLMRKLAALFWPGPLTMVLKRHLNIPANVSAGMDTVAIRMPSHPVALALLRAANTPVAAPSANLFARPSATTAQHVLEDLGGHVDIILDAGPAVIGVESTVLDLTQEPPTVLRPGGIPLEQLRILIPDVQMKAKYLQVEDAPGASPGMLVKHYSPHAQLLLFDGNFEHVIHAMQKMAQKLLSEGKRVGIMTSDMEKHFFDATPAKVATLGKNLDEISHNLFTAMRELDAREVDAILVRGFEREGLGAAIWDRLLRAAEGKVIVCE